MDIVIIDGRGGHVGKLLAEGLIKRVPEETLTVIGTNGIATSCMAKTGVKNAATGENAVIVACRRADIITGPQGIIITDALMGEITPAMAAAVAQCRAQKVLLPFLACGVTVVGVKNLAMAEYVDLAVKKIAELAGVDGAD